MSEETFPPLHVPVAFAPGFTSARALEGAAEPSAARAASVDASDSSVELSSDRTSE